MLSRALSLLPVLLAATLAAGCGSGGGSSSRAQASSSTTGASTSGSATLPGGSTTPGTTPPGTTPPTSTGGSGGSGGQTGESVRTFGGRQYVLFAPPRRSSAPQPLVVLFHGSGDDALNFANTAKVVGWFQAATAEDVILCVPSTKSPYQSFPVWSGNPNNDVPQMKTELADVLSLVTQDILTRYDVDTRSIHGLGFSDGGLFLGAVGLAEPTFATTTILGYGWGAFYVTTPPAKRPVHLACGSADQFYAAANTTQGFLRTSGHEVLWEPVPGVGHLFSGVSQAIQPRNALDWMTSRPLSAAATPTAPPATTPPGSFPANPARGLVTRPVTTTAQGGIPAASTTYQLYVPTTYTSATAYPLVFAANMGLTPWQALAEQEKVIVVDFRDFDRNGGFDFGRDVLLLDAVLRDVGTEYRCDPKRTYYHGFSAGAHWGYAVVLANANLFGALAVNAGSLNIAIQQGVFPGQVQRKLPVAIRHGAQDAVVPVSEGRLARDRLTQAGHTVVLEEFQGGHAVSAADAASVWAFLRQHQAP